MADGTAAGPRLLIAYDGTDAGKDAIGAAGALFPGSSALVAVVRLAPDVPDHIALGRVAVPDAVLVRAAEQQRQAAERAADAVADEGRLFADGGGLLARSEVRTGATAWRELSDLAEREDVDVLVCGIRRQPAISRAVLGSTSSSLLYHVRRPLLLVPEGTDQLDGPALIGYDGSEGSREAVIAAAKLLAPRHAVVTHVWCSPVAHTLSGAALVHVPVPEISEMVRDLDRIAADQAQEVADEGAGIAGDHGLAAEGAAIESPGRAWRALTEAARARGASVIVAGRRGRGAIGSTVLGSTSAGLTHHADRPVLVLPGVVG